MAGATIENFINKWGEVEGLKKHLEYIDKLKNRPRPTHPNNKKYWGAKKIITNYDKKLFICLRNAPKSFFEQFEKIWADLRDNNPKFDSSQLYSKTNKILFTAKSQIKKEYWLQRFWSEEEALEKMTKKRTEQIANELWYIKKYGEEKGKEIWSEKCDSSNILMNWTKKFGKEKAIEMFEAYKNKLKYAKTFDGWFKKYGGTLLEYQEFVKLNTNQNITVSKISQELFNGIINKAPIYARSHFGEDEQLIPVPKELKRNGVSANFFPDFLFDGKIIEFYGDYWHKNPKTYDSSDEHKKVREYDFIREEILTELGYELKIVWEHEYLENAEGVIDACILFLKK